MKGRTGRKINLIYRAGFFAQPAVGRKQCLVPFGVQQVLYGGTYLVAGAGVAQHSIEQEVAPRPDAAILDSWASIEVA